MTVKTKAILLVTSVIITLSIFYSAHQISEYDDHIDSLLNNEKHDFHHVFNSTQNFYYSIYTNWLDNFIANNPENIKAFALRDRERLYDLTRPLYERLRRSQPYIYIMHFHLPDGRSFLRMHSPEEYGDDLSRIRPAIQTVHENKKLLTGYEIGLYGAFYRIIQPVFHLGQYVGVVELGVRVEEIIDAMHTRSGIDTAVFFNNDLWQKAKKSTLAQIRTGGYTIIEEQPVISACLPPGFVIQPRESHHYSADGKHYLILTLEGLSNCFQQPIGGIIAVKDITGQVLEKKSFIVKSLVVTAALAAVCIIFLSVNFQALIGTLEDAKKTQDGLIVQLNDEITVRAKAEKAMVESERQQRHILNSLPDSILLLDREFTVQWANQAALDRISDFVGRKCDFCCAGGSPTRQDCLCKKSFLTGKITRETIHCANLSGRRGETYWEAIAIPQYDASNQLSGTLTVLRDVTKRIQAEEKIKELNRQNSLLLESAGEGIYGVDRNGFTTFMNPAAQRMTGFTEEEMIGKHQHRLLHHTKKDGSPYPEEECPILATIRDNRPYFVSSEHFWRKDGTSFPVEYVATPVIEDSVVIGSVVLFSDITERIMLEKQLLHAQKMEAVGRLTGGIAHDFNNLLTTILGYSELLLMKLEDQKYLQDRVKLIYQAGKMAASLTGQLLAFSRKQVLEIKTIHLNSIIDRLAKMLRRLIGENIVLELRYMSSDCYIRADAGQCEQIIMNLAINAKDAMPDGGTLAISTEIVEIEEETTNDYDDIPPGNYVLLTVGDSGMGIEADTKKHIFEPFFTTKEQGKGTGLGLATAYGIVKQHNGYIDLESTPGHGTTFRIFFPVAEAGPMDEQELPSGEMPRGTETILVVDDSASIRQLIKETLTPLGYTVLEANGGEAALKTEAPAGQDIVLLVTDVFMPGMNGKELAQTMKPLHGSLKVLYMSGYTTSGFIRDEIIEQGTHFMQKPLSPVQISRKVRETLDS